MRRPPRILDDLLAERWARGDRKRVEGSKFNHHWSQRARPRDRIWAGRARGAHGMPVSAPFAARGWGATRCVTPRQTCPRPEASGATCVQRLDGSRDSAIHTKYRISLRSSSMREPRYPLPRVVIDISRDDRSRRPRPRTARGGGTDASSFRLTWRALRRGSLARVGTDAGGRRPASGERVARTRPPVAR